MFRNRMLGGASFLPLFNAEGGAGGAGGGGAGGGATAGGAAGAGGNGSAGGGDRLGTGAGANGGGAGGAAPGGGSAGEGAGGAGAGTLAGGGSGGAAAAAAAAVTGGAPAFSDKWREQLAGDDKAALTDLAKYTDPGAMYKSLRELQGKISKGELKAAAQPLPANATDEQKTAWRAANGLPASKDDYVKALALPEGMVLGEADKPLVDAFAQRMFDQGGTPAEMNRAVSWFYQTLDAQKAEQVKADGRFQVDSEVALRTEWSGAEFEKNMNAFGAFKSQLPGELQEMLFTARTADGQVLGNHPAFIKIGAALGRELNPAATIVTAGQGTAVAVGDRIKAIEATMYKDGKPNQDYWGNEAIQKEYRDLQDAQLKMNARGKAA